MKHEIEIPGLPKGWRAVAYRTGNVGEMADDGYCISEPDRSKPPCLICGAMTEKEAEVMCWRSVDDDSCHGQELWP